GASTLNFTGGTIRIEKSSEQFRPSPGTYDVGGTVYTNTRVISGPAGDDARPTLELANGAFFAARLYAGNISDGSVLIGINGGKGAIRVDGAGLSGGVTRPSLLQSSAADGGGYIVVGGGGTVINEQFVPGDGILHIAGGAEANSSAIFIGTSGGTG